MAASIAAVKKELRKKIKSILKDLPEAAAASQSTQWLLCVCCKSLPF
jgi:5-formyltetrahydrofolate cyclo-ligase